MIKSIGNSFCLNQANDLSCEVLVIGAGVGGSTVAHELVKAGFDTLLVDEGPCVPYDYQSKYNFVNISTLWRNGGLSAALGRPPIAYAEARCVGGGSEINSGIFQRLPVELISQWQHDYQIKSFSKLIFDVYYREIEELINLEYPELYPDSLILKNAANKLGWKGKKLKCAQKDLTKQSMTQTLIPAALQNGLRLISHAKINQLKTKSNLAIGKVYDRQGSVHKLCIKAKYIFICGGAIYTPTLLLKSGIKKNIGDTLQLHPTIKVLARFEDKISEKRSAVPTYAITEFMPYIRLGGSVYNHSFFAMSVAEDYQRRKNLLKEMDYCGIYYAMIKPQGKGKIRMLPGSNDPLVTYKLTKVDWKNLSKGLEYLRKAMFASGADFVIPSIAKHQGWNSINEDIGFVAKQASLMSIHLFSSCPMGENIDKCAVNSFGQLHGFDNLFIADASIIPEAPGTNPQSIIMALALRNVRAFIENNKSRIV